LRSLTIDHYDPLEIGNDSRHIGIRLFHNSEILLKPNICAWIC
jgi:hypothetical protein